MKSASRSAKTFSDDARRARGLSEQTIGVKLRQLFQELVLCLTGGLGLRQRLADLFRYVIDVAGVERCGLRKCCVIAASGVHRAQTAYKLDAHALLYLFDLTQQDVADLAGGAHVRPAASGKVKVRNVDQPQVAGLLGRKLAQAQLPRFFQRHKADAYRTVFCNHFIGQQFRFLCLRGGEAGGLQIDGAALFPHVKADRGHIEKLNERSGEHMLAGVLLHVVAAAGGIHAALDLSSHWERRSGKMKDASVFLIGNLGDGNLLSLGKQHAEIVHLAATGRVKRRAVEHDRGPAVAV